MTTHIRRTARTADTSLSPIFKPFAYPYHTRHYFARSSTQNVPSSPALSTKAHMKLPPTPKFNPKTGKWEVPPSDLPMPSPYTNITYEHGHATGTRQLSTEKRAYSPEGVQLTGYPQPKALSKEWTGSQLEHIIHQNELRQAYEKTIGGEDPFIAGSRLTPVLDAFKRGAIPMQQVMAMRALVQKYQNKQMSQNELVRALQQYGAQSTEHKQGSSSVDFSELETRAQRLNQMRVVQPDVNQHIEDMAEYLKQPVEQVRKLIGNLTDQQYRAVTSTAQAVTIFGGPGGGKTHALAQRAAQLESLGADLNKFLVVSASHAGSQAFVNRLKGDMAVAHPYTKVNEIQGRTPWSHAMSFLHQGFTDEKGNRTTAMQEMGHGTYKPMSGSKTKVDPNDLSSLTSQKAIGEGEREYLEKVLAQFGIKVQDMSQVAQDIKTAKENRLITTGDNSFKARLESGKRKYEAHELNHPDTYLYLYEQSRQMAVKAITDQGTPKEKVERFGIKGQTNPLFDLSDTLHFGRVAAKRPANRKRLVEGIFADEAQDFAPDALGYLAAVAKPGAQIVMAGDMSQQNIFKENHVDELIGKIMKNQGRTFEAIELTGSNRLNPWNTALVNSLSANEALKNMPKSPYMTSIAPGSSYPDPADFPDFRYEPTWQKTYQNAIEKWFDEMGVTPHGVAQNLQEGRTPFHGAAMEPQQYPHIFMMKEQRRLFEQGLQQYMMQQLGGEAAEQILPKMYTSATPSEATLGLMHGSMMSQMKGKESERAMVTMSRGGLWEFHQYQNQLLTMGSRVKGRQTFYGSGQNLGSKVYDQRPDLYQGVKLPQGTLGIVSRLLENAVVQQGVEMDRIPTFWQPLAKMVFANKSVEGQSAPVDTHAMQTLSSFVQSAIKQRFVQPLHDNEKSGLMQGEHMEELFDEEGRSKMAGFQTYAMTPERLAGKHEQHIDMKRFELAREAFRQIVEGGPKAMEAYGYKGVPDIETMMSGNAVKGSDIPQFIRPDRRVYGDTALVPQKVDERHLVRDRHLPNEVEPLHAFALQFLGNESVQKIGQQAMDQLPLKKIGIGNIGHGPGDLNSVFPEHDMPEKFADQIQRPEDSPFMTHQSQEQARNLANTIMAHPTFRTHEGGYELLRKQFAHPKMMKMIEEFTQKHLPGEHSPFRFMQEDAHSYEKQARIAHEEKNFDQERLLLRQAELANSPEQISSIVEDLFRKNTYPDLSKKIPYKAASLTSLNAENMADIHDIAGDLGQDKSLHPALQSWFRASSEQLQMLHDPLPQGEKENRPPITLSQEALDRLAWDNPLQARHLQHIMTNEKGVMQSRPDEAMKNIARLAPIPSHVLRTIGAEGYDLGVTPAHSHVGEFTTGLESVYNQWEGSMYDIDSTGGEQGGILDPMHGMSQELPGGGSAFHPHGSSVTLSGYQTRLKDMLRSQHHTLQPEHRAQMEGHLAAIGQLKERFTDPLMREQYGHQLNIMARLALGQNPLDPHITMEDRKRGKKEPIDEFFAPQKDIYSKGRTLKGVVRYANALQTAMEHTQRTGTIKRAHMDELLTAMGHKPNSDLFKGLEFLKTQKKFQKPEDTISLTEMIHTMFPSEANRLAGELTPTPLRPEQEMVFTGTPQGPQQKGRMQTGMRGEIAAFPALSVPQLTKLHQAYIPQREIPSYQEKGWLLPKLTKFVTPIKRGVLNRYQPKNLARRLGSPIKMMNFGESRGRIHMTSKFLDMMSPQEKETLAKLYQEINIYGVDKQVTAGVPFLFNTGTKQFPVLASQVMPAHIYDRLQQQNGGGEIRLTPPSSRVVEAGPGSGALATIAEHLTQKAHSFLAPVTALAQNPPIPPPTELAFMQAPPVPPMAQIMSPQEAELLQTVKKINMIQPGRMASGGGSAPASRRRRALATRRAGQASAVGEDPASPIQRITGFLPSELPPHPSHESITPPPIHKAIELNIPPPSNPTVARVLARVEQNRKILAQGGGPKPYSGHGGSKRLVTWEDITHDLASPPKSPASIPPPIQSATFHSVADASPFNYTSFDASVVGTNTIPPDRATRNATEIARKSGIPFPGSHTRSNFPAFVRNLPPHGTPVAGGGSAGSPPPPPTRTGFALPPDDDDEGRGLPSPAQFHAPPTMAASMADLHRWLREGNAAQGIQKPSNEQLEVLDDASHHKIIEGGPGGGKTATLMRAVMEAITNGGIRPDQVQMFSAMHSGTQALEQSYGPSKHGPGYQALLPKGDEYRFKGPSTFHSVASSILTHGAMHDEEGKLFFPNLQKLGLGHLTGNIMEEPSQEQLAGMGTEDRRKALANAPSTMLRELLAQHGENPSQDQLFNHLKEINRIKNQRGMPDGHYEESLAAGRYQLTQPGIPMTYEGMTALHEQGLHQRGAMDFQDSLHYATRALDELPDQNIPKHLFNTKLVAVDEAQDTTHGAMSFLQSFLRRIGRTGNTPRVFVGMDRMQSLMQNLGGIDQHQIKGHFQSLLNVPWVHGLTKNFRSDAGAVALNNAILQDPLLKGEPKSPEQVPINSAVGKGIDFQLAKSQPTLYKKMVRSMFGQAGLDPRTIATNIQAGQHALAGINWQDGSHQGTLPSQIPAIVSTRDQQALLEHEAHQMLMDEGLSHHEAQRGVSQLFRRTIPSSNAPVEQKEALTQFPVLRVGGSRSFQFQEPHVDATRVGGWLSKVFDVDKSRSYLRNLFTGVSRVSTGGQAHIFAANRTFYKNQLHSYMNGASFSDTQPDNPEDGAVELNGHAILARNNPQNAFEHYNGQLVPQMFSGILGRRDAQLQQWQKDGFIAGGGALPPPLSGVTAVRSNTPRPAGMASSAPPPTAQVASPTSPLDPFIPIRYANGTLASQLPTNMNLPMAPPPARTVAAGAPTPQSGSGGAVNITMPPGGSVNVNAPSVQVNTTGATSASTPTGSGGYVGQQATRVGVPASQLFSTPIPGGGPSMTPPRSGPISGGGRQAGTGSGGPSSGGGHSAFNQYNNEPSQFGHSMARIGSELQYLGQLGSTIVDKALQQASDYRQATIPLAGNVSGQDGTTGFFNFQPGGNNANNINEYSHNQLPMYSNTQVARGIQNLTGMTNTQFSQGQTLPALTDIMGLAAMTGMDSTQLMGQMTQITGTMGGGPNATVANTRNLAGMLTGLYGSNLTESNVSPTLDALQSTLPTVQGLSAGTNTASSQIMGLFQLGLQSGMTSNNLGQVGNVVNTLSQIGSTPNLQQQYGLSQLYGQQNITAAPELAQYQQEQIGGQESLARLRLQQNIGGGMSLPTLQIKISQAQVQMDHAELAMSQGQLQLSQVEQQQSQLQQNYNVASFAEQQSIQNAQYGKVGQDTSKTAYFSWLRSQNAAAYNGTSPEIATKFTPAPTFGLQNAQFYAGIEHQRTQMVLGRSPLLSDMAFQDNMKYLNQQEAFYQAQLKLTNEQRQFEMDWQPKLLAGNQKVLDVQLSLLGIQKQELTLRQQQFGLEQQMATYEQKNDAITNAYLGQEADALANVLGQRKQQITGKGPINGQTIQPQQLVEQLASKHMNDSQLQQSIRQLGVPLDQQQTLFQLVKQLSKQGGTLTEIDKKFQSATDAGLRTDLDKLIKGGAFSSGEQQAAGANASLDFAGLGANFDLLTKTLELTNTYLENLSNFFSPTASFVLSIAAIASVAGPLVTAVASIGNIMGIIQAIFGGGAAGGAGAGAGGAIAGGAIGAGGIIGAGLIGTGLGALWGWNDSGKSQQGDWGSALKNFVPGWGMGKMAGDLTSLVQNKDGDKGMQSGWNNFWGMFNLGPNGNKMTDHNTVETTPGARTKHGGLAVMTYHDPSTSTSSDTTNGWTQFWKNSTKDWQQWWKDRGKDWHQWFTDRGKDWQQWWKDRGKDWHQFWTDRAKDWHQFWTDRGKDWHQFWVDRGKDWNTFWKDRAKDWQSWWTDRGKDWSTFWSDRAKGWDQWWSDRAKGWDSWWSQRGKDFQTWLDKLNIFNWGKPSGGGASTGGVAEGHPGFITPHVNADFHQRMHYGVHQGVDFAASQGTPLTAFSSGKVVGAGFHPWGGEVDVDMGNGLIERYLHLSLIGVTNGQKVGRGQRIGLTGGGTPQSGLGYWSSGAHSHVQVDTGNINAGINPWPIWAMAGDTNLAQFYTGNILNASEQHSGNKGGGGGIGSSLHYLSQGGVVMSQMKAELAEGGEPEAVIPLSRLTSVLQSTFNSTAGSASTPARSVALSKIAEKLEIHVHTTAQTLDESAQDSLMTQLLSIFNDALKEMTGKLI